jgi:hypothetical protein
MDRFSIVGTLNSGGPETAPDDAERRPKANGDQPIEDVIWSFREWERSGHGLPFSNPIRCQSDPPIVVRDGNAGHTASHGYAGASKAKEWAGGQRKHSTHRGPCRSRQMVSRSLLATGTDSGTLCPSRFQVRVFLRSPLR